MIRGTVSHARSKFSTWMYRIALNVSISFQRRERIRTHEPLLGVLLEPEAPQTEGSVERQMPYRWIDGLERPLDKALVLLFLEGEPHQGIAEILGITESNVATKLGRLKDTMRKDLAGI
jgi:RNA polymerase sigma-70 factor (ECF subfamily)